MVRFVAQRHLGRFRRRHLAPSASIPAIVLAFLGLLLVLMPVSYKAGTATAHPHTVFQAIVDQVRGETHSHGDDSSTPAGAIVPATQPAFFLALNIPLSTFADMASPAAAIELMLRTHHLLHDLGVAPAEQESDLPELTSVHGGTELASALTLLASIWALLLLRQPMRRIWFSQRILRGIRDALEGPPPRPVAA